MNGDNSVGWVYSLERDDTQGWKPCGRCVGLESVGLRPLGALNGAFNTYSHVYMVDLDEAHVGVRAGSIRWVGTGPIQMYILDPPFWYVNRFRVAVRIAS